MKYFPQILHTKKAPLRKGGWGVTLAMLALSLNAPAQQHAAIGSKKFTESYVLGEIAKRAARDRGIEAAHKQGMGGTIILWKALASGAIDAYPEYTGTIAEEILKNPSLSSLAGITAALDTFGVAVTKPLGFNNTYALAMRRTRAAELGLASISDLRQRPDLAFGLSHEFLGRSDGWKPLAAAYDLAPTDVRGVDHALAYSALARGEIDVVDAYSTDAKIAEFDLVVLNDDRNFFPRYDAVFLYRKQASPQLIGALQSLEGTIPESKMIALNAEAERTHDYNQAASLYFGSRASDASDGLLSRTASRVLRHLELVIVSLFFAMLFGIPLGILASRNAGLAAGIIGTAGVIQTIPSLALLALLVAIPFLGISVATAIFALFLYSLLPIIRSTASGLASIPLSLRESAEALGLEPAAQLRKIYLPLASRQIMSGIKTSAIINVGAATLAALIGAGGLGEPIISGLNLNDTATILEGALPAAALAIAVEVVFWWLDRIFIPKGLRLERLTKI